MEDVLLQARRETQLKKLGESVSWRCRRLERHAWLSCSTAWSGVVITWYSDSHRTPDARAAMRGATDRAAMPCLLRHSLADRAINSYDPLKSLGKTTNGFQTPLRDYLKAYGHQIEISLPRVRSQRGLGALLCQAQLTYTADMPLWQYSTQFIYELCLRSRQAALAKDEGAFLICPRLY